MITLFSIKHVFFLFPSDILLQICRCITCCGRQVTFSKIFSHNPCLQWRSLLNPQESVTFSIWQIHQN